MKSLYRKLLNQLSMRAKYYYCSIRQSKVNKIRSNARKDLTRITNQSEQTTSTKATLLSAIIYVSRYVASLPQPAATLSSLMACCWHSVVRVMVFGKSLKKTVNQWVHLVSKTSCFVAVVLTWSTSHTH